MYFSDGLASIWSMTGHPEIVKQYERLFAETEFLYFLLSNVYIPIGLLGRES